MPVDALQAQARSAGAKLFCTLRGLNGSFRVQLSYGWDIAMALCKGWVAKMLFVYDIVDRSGDPHYRPTPAELAAFREDAEFTNAARMLAGNARGMQLVHVARALFS